MQVFQFHKGTIKTKNGSLVGIGRIIDFNSIKVRLKLGANDEALKLYGFQFHKGTIKTLLVLLPLLFFLKFQFHKGTIKTR